MHDMVALARGRTGEQVSMQRGLAVVDMAVRDYTHDLVGIQIDRIVGRRKNVAPPKTEDRPWPRSMKIFSGDLRKAALAVATRIAALESFVEAQSELFVSGSSNGWWKPFRAKAIGR
jgi:hypothetical protein